MDILELLSSQLTNKETVSGLSKSIGADKDQVQSAMSMILPTLLNGMSNNVQSESGLNSLMGALDQHADTDVSNINNFLGGMDLSDGMKILGHLLGNNDTKTVSKNVAKNTGLSQTQSTDLMSTLASMIMGSLGNQKSKGGLNGNTLLSMLTGAKGNDMLSMVTSLLDKDKDGDIMDDLGNLLGGFFNKK